MKRFVQFISIIACFTAFALSTTDIDINEDSDPCNLSSESELISKLYILE